MSLTPISSNYLCPSPGRLWGQTWDKLNSCDNRYLADHKSLVPLSHIFSPFWFVRKKITLGQPPSPGHCRLLLPTATDSSKINKVQQTEVCWTANFHSIFPKRSIFTAWFVPFSTFFLHFFLEKSRIKLFACLL